MTPASNARLTSAAEIAEAMKISKKSETVKIRGPVGFMSAPH